MYKVVILTNPESSDGFRLAGVDVRTAERPEEAHQELVRLVDDESTGIIALHQMFVPLIDERMRRKIDTSYRPIVVPLPIQERLVETESHTAYLARLIRRAVGFDITLRRD